MPVSTVTRVASGTRRSPVPPLVAARDRRPGRRIDGSARGPAATRCPSMRCVCPAERTGVPGSAPAPSPTMTNTSVSLRSRNEISVRFSGLLSRRVLIHHAPATSGSRRSNVLSAVPSNLAVEGPLVLRGLAHSSSAGLRGLLERRSSRSDRRDRWAEQAGRARGSYTTAVSSCPEASATRTSLRPPAAVRASGTRCRRGVRCGGGTRRCAARPAARRSGPATARAGSVGLDAVVRAPLAHEARLARDADERVVRPQEGAVEVVRVLPEVRGPSAAPSCSGPCTYVEPKSRRIHTRYSGTSAGARGRPSGSGPRPASCRNSSGSKESATWRAARGGPCGSSPRSPHPARRCTAARALLESQGSPRYHPRYVLCAIRSRSGWRFFSCTPVLLA